jgi:hypothetical protein
LVSAWGLPQTRTRVWQIDVVDAEQAGVDRVAAEHRAEGQADRSRSGRSSSRRPAISSAPRSAVIRETGLAKGV